MSSDRTAAIQAFITEWQVSGGEMSNAQSFIIALCDVLEVQAPQVATAKDSENAYVFERVIPSADGTIHRIDCYKRGCFVLECKQGVSYDDVTPLSEQGQKEKKQLKTGHGKHGTKGFDTAMLKAREQAQRYARALPKDEIADGRPPFVIVVDIGHSIDLYTDWSRMGGEYVPFPDPASYRIALKDLVRPEVRELLRAVWTDPLSLDPSRRSAKVTREIADRLAKLAKTLEGKHDPEHVANFLMRCLFTMFSEDVDLLPHGSFTTLLGKVKKDPSTFTHAMASLWSSMNTGGYAPMLQQKVPRFNGGLFAHADAIDLNADQIQLLLEASSANWKDVEPAIFGTLLERALDPRERHKLGAHYTPRAYVERLVNPTVIEPLREQWKSVQVAALQLHDKGDTAKAVKQLEKFLYELGNIRVLDPACGSGNFLYVTLELLKRLEGEVLNAISSLTGGRLKLEYDTHTVTPANFFGIELNPRAAAIAEQVLWIGFLQWHLRTHGNLQNLLEPIIKDLHNIECRDAVLEYDNRTEQRDANGKVVTRWDGHTTKKHPVTGEDVPDPEARVPVYTYAKPRPAKWPQADYIVGNPPFIGNKRMRLALGDGYAEALREAWIELPENIDFVMYWWDRAAELTRTGKTRRFGFITTNSLRQTFNRKVLEKHLTPKKPISMVYAIPDHPWVDSADGAAVRVAMTVAIAGTHKGVLQEVIKEVDSPTDEAAEVTLSFVSGAIHADLTAGSNVAAAEKLQANEDICFQGMNLVGKGFRITEEEVYALGYDPKRLPNVIKPHCNARDMMQGAEHIFVIDFFGFTAEQAKAQHPTLYQRLFDRVKPERDHNKDAQRKRDWWLFGRSNRDLRASAKGIKRFILTPETSKHRVFSFYDLPFTPDHKLYAICSEDAWLFGVLSSEFQRAWASTAGGRMGVGNDLVYNNTQCFLTFPFPACTPGQQEKIRALGEQLDAHRKRQQALHPELTMTGMYNVLEALREGRVLTAKEKKIHEQGLLTILKQLHDDLDAAVADAYGWPANLSTDEILSRLVALNAERAAEEAKGQIRWLRPEYQNPRGKSASGKVASGVQAKLVEEEAPAVNADDLQAWPDELPEQAAALSAVLTAIPQSVAELAARFEGKRTKKRLEEIEELLETLKAVGRARFITGGEGGWASSG